MIDRSLSDPLVFSVEGARALDRAVETELGLPTIVLMENAARSLAEASLALMRERTLDQVAIVCGPGNNGGDGLALARHLACRGLDPFVGLTQPADMYKGDAATNLRAVEALDLRLIDPILAMAPQAAMAIVFRNGAFGSTDEELRRLLVVDALLGTGISRAPSPPIERAIRWMNGLRGRGATILAIDVPTGLDADTGIPAGEHVVHSDVTVTLGGLKKGLLEPGSARYTGKLLVGDLGVPPAFMRRFALPPSRRFEA
ncbi:MAG: NAD(P)H-hydrate epimerase [Planctomycetota bacterium]|nr:NAD(P)H-hydrate epimerase [Planctomycetota bacterium]